EDILLIYYALQAAKIPNPVHIVRSGEETISYLNAYLTHAALADQPLPSLLLLDLKMPRMNGFQVLHWIQQRHKLQSIKVAALSSSDLIWDRFEAQRLGASAFIVKPNAFHDLARLSEALRDHWPQTSETSWPRPNESTWIQGVNH